MKILIDNICIYMYTYVKQVPQVRIQIQLLRMFSINLTPFELDNLPYTRSTTFNGKN